MNNTSLFKNVAISFFAFCLIVYGLYYLNNGSWPLQKPLPLTSELPPANSPASMSIYQIPTGVNHRSAAFAYRGGSFFDKRDFSMSVLLVHHPKGDLLIDAGFGSNAKEHFGSMPFYFRAITDFNPGTPAAVQLTKAGYNIDSLKGILLTHAHWDHVSGLPDFANIPVMVCKAEMDYIKSNNKLSELARSFTHTTYITYGFQKKPYLGFDSSYDVFDDGSVVVVPAPGHTPGSVVIFINLPSGKRYAMIGDLAWQAEGVLNLEERPLLQSLLGDNNEQLVCENLKKMYAIIQKHPEIKLVPAHDPRAFEQIPGLNDWPTR
jgi:glyoxylase-like metal-dependent hydrolase (beta-lactamase superfamily II)